MHRMKAAATISTADELLRAGDVGRCELIRGELVMMSPAGANHGRVVSRLDRRLGRHVESHGLGEVFGAETGFLISRSPDTVRAPDLAFVTAARAADIPERGFFPGPPDLAVEVLSPDDRPAAVLAKVNDWLAAGSSAVWLVDPQRREIRVHVPAAAPRVLGPDDELSGDALLPGFRVRVGEVFG